MEQSRQTLEEARRVVDEEVAEANRVGAEESVGLPDLQKVLEGMERRILEQPLDVSTAGLLKFFRYGHLPTPLQRVSRLYAGIAAAVVLNVPPGPERTVALRKLLESKDAAVRAAL